MTTSYPPCNCGMPDEPRDGKRLQEGTGYWIAYCDRCGRYDWRPQTNSTDRVGGYQPRGAPIPQPKVET